MAYISSDGKIRESVPYLKRITGFFSNIIFIIVMFFMTLMNRDTSKSENGYFAPNYRPSSGPPRPPSRRFGQYGNTRNHSVDIPISGCSSCGG